MRKPVYECSLISTFVVRCLEYNTSSFYIHNFKPLASFCGCADRVESTLVANPENRFSRDEAHFNKKSTLVRFQSKECHKLAK